MRRRLVIKLTALALVLLGLAVFGRDRIDALFRVPPSTADMVWDQAGLLDASQLKFVSHYHQVLRTDFDTDLRVLTVAGEVDVAQLAVREFAARKVGSRSATGRGLLLVIAPAANKVRLEVSEALEPVFTDAFVAYLQQRQMVPFFQSGRVANGILATTELIYTRAVEAQKGEAFDPRKYAASSSGGGAQTAANIGAGYDASVLPQRREAVQAGDDPGVTVQAYLTAMDNRDARPDLPIYSKATRQMLAGWTVTPAQMDNISQTYKACSAEVVRMAPDKQRAVLRYPVGERTCSPWFLVMEDGAWRLDLTMMQRALRFNHRNQWHFAPGVDHEYWGAFADWRFDRNGYPYEMSETQHGQ